MATLLRLSYAVVVRSLYEYNSIPSTLGGNLSEKEVMAILVIVFLHRIISNVMDGYPMETTAHST